MFKILKRILIFLIVVILVIGALSIYFLKSIQYEVTSDELPQDVYDTSGDILAYAKTEIVGLVAANDDERYTLIEEIMNLIIFNSIRNNINSSYNPLSGSTDESVLNIVHGNQYYIDYAFAKLNTDKQLVITISGGFNMLIHESTAIIMVFDVDFNLLTLNPNVTFTLDKAYLGEKEVSRGLLNFALNRIGKDSIESSMTFGTLNLTDYTYKITISDAIS